MPRSAVVHTDDIAWWHSAFDWSALMVDGVLGPVRRGESVNFRPPAWETRGRPGAVTVPAGTSVLFVEGVGAGRHETTHLVDTLIWVQSDRVVRHQREAARIAAGETAAEESERWLREEIPFVAAQRPWERAHIVVSGTPDMPHNPDTQVVVADPPTCATDAAADSDRATQPRGSRQTGDEISDEESVPAPLMAE